MSDSVLYKTSIFVHCAGTLVYHDLTNGAYHCDREDVALLRRLSESPATLQTLARAAADVEELELRLRFFLQERLIVPASSDETGDFAPMHVDIETCRQCNARCRYCPQSVAPKSRGVMPLDLFELVLSRLGGTPPEWVALNHYGEPLLDPFFRERVRMLRERRFPLSLYTNGTLLKEATIDFLSEGGLAEVVFNFPSLDPAEWSALMGLPEKSYLRARRAIEYYLTDGTAPPGGVAISVNVNDDGQEQRARDIREHFSAFGDVLVKKEFTNSRAGSIRNEFVRITSRAATTRYAGCERFVNHLHVSWEAKVFLCCQDYEQSVILGHLRQEEIASIMSSPHARQLRAELYGLAPMAAGRLCLDCHMLRRRRFLGPHASGKDDDVSI